MPRKATSCLLLAACLLMLSTCQGQSCPAGEVFDGFSCSKCSYGEFQTVQDGKAACVKCPVNTFASAPGATECQKCPPGQLTYYDGSSSCESCLVGQIPGKYPSGNPTCVDCPDGTYTPKAGSPTCLKCAAGSYIEMSGGLEDTWSCVKCPAGTVAHNTTSAQRCYNDSTSFCCDKCEPGTFSATAGALSCQACPAGTYQPDSNATSCLPCPPGSYSPTPGAAACKTTDIGFYQDKAGQSAQVACPAGTVGLITGGESQAAACFPYTTGRYSFTEKQDRILTLVIRSFGTNAAIQGLGRDMGRVMDSGSSSGCGGFVYGLETYYMCTRQPYIAGYLDKSTCTSQPTDKPGESGCVSYSFYALSNSSYAWVIQNNNTQTSTCLLNPGEQEARCQFLEQVESTTYRGEWIYFSNVKQASSNAQITNVPVGAPPSGSSGVSGSAPLAATTNHPGRWQHTLLAALAGMALLLLAL